MMSELKANNAQLSHRAERDAKELIALNQQIQNLSRQNELLKEKAIRDEFELMRLKSLIEQPKKQSIAINRSEQGENEIKYLRQRMTELEMTILDLSTSIKQSNIQQSVSEGYIKTPFLKISKMSPNICEETQQKNQYTDASFETLLHKIKKGELNSLDLAEKEMTDNQVIQLCEILKTNPPVKKLDLSYNEITTESMKAVHDMLLQNNTLTE